ncbi:golgin subfamily A member 6-like protein 22 [Gossypium hirsutum]|uniref:Golgin subfamily A member 6-like protein 22 n=1 Tax=Gossypium hirsutum TaxID=3635 RepID=A0A1U8ISZ7_GOSHI|nr:golgin subfamily A member 6-like protein 22 [Gossypium hirsutum]
MEKGFFDKVENNAAVRIWAETTQQEKGDNLNEGSMGSRQREQRINDNISTSDQENPRSIEEHLKVISSELEIIRQDFERKSLELEKRIEQLEEEKIQLGLDVDVQKLEAERPRKGKNKAEEDLDSLKTEYKKLSRSMRTAGLRKTSEQWRQEVKEEKSKANQWEEKFWDAQAREGALKRSLVESQNEKEGLKIRVSELERSLYQYRTRKSIELLEVNNERLREQLHQSQDQVRNRDYVMGEALTQVREVADHLQKLVVQANVLSLKYESESDRGRELAWLLRQVKALSIRAKPYM